MSDRRMDARQIQTACDRCTQGVMDSTNPHLTGTCPCYCHPENNDTSPSALQQMSVEELEARVDHWVQHG